MAHGAAVTLHTAPVRAATARRAVTTCPSATAARRPCVGAHTRHAPHATQPPAHTLPTATRGVHGATRTPRATLSRRAVAGGVAQARASVLRTQSAQWDASGTHTHARHTRRAIHHTAVRTHHEDGCLPGSLHGDGRGVGVEVAHNRWSDGWVVGGAWWLWRVVGEVVRGGRATRTFFLRPSSLFEPTGVHLLLTSPCDSISHNVTEPSHLQKNPIF